MCMMCMMMMMTLQPTRIALYCINSTRFDLNKMAINNSTTLCVVPHSLNWLTKPTWLYAVTAIWCNKLSIIYIHTHTSISLYARYWLSNSLHFFCCQQLQQQFASPSFLFYFQYLSVFCKYFFIYISCIQFGLYVCVSVCFFGFHSSYSSISLNSSTTWHSMGVCECVLPWIQSHNCSL